MRRKLMVLLIVFLLGINFSGNSQSIFGSKGYENDSAKDQSSEIYRSKFSPFIAPSVSPEVDFMLVAGGLYSFKMRPSDTTVQPSSIPFSIGYSTNQSFLFNVRPNLFFPRDEYRIRGDIWVKDMPHHYWGVGYDKNVSIEKSDTTTSFWRYWSKIDLKFNRRVVKDLYAGILIDFNYTHATQLNVRMKQDENVLKDGTEIRNSGIGINLEYDTRDVAVNAYSGMFLNVSWTNYGELLGGNYDYNTYLIDYRQYKTIQRKGRRLAWQIKSRLSNGDVPWAEMSQLGTPFDLRGYTWGHFRDREMIFGLLEYRHKFLRKKAVGSGDMLSKHGVVAWIGTGSIAHSVTKLKNWLPNGGIGYRFEIQPRMNARVDFGVGKEAFGFYVSFSEAF